MNTKRRSLLLTTLGAAALASVFFGGAPVSASAAASPARLTGVSIALSAPHIYPEIDGYRDSLGIAVSPTLEGTGPTSTLTGTVSVSRSGHLVAHYPIVTSAPETYSWNGRVKGVIVPGTYTVTAKAVDGDTSVVKHAQVRVSLGHLVTRTTVVTMSAQKFFQHGYTALSTVSGSGKTGCARSTAGSLSCVSVKGTAASGHNFLTVPAPVLSFASVRPYSATVSLVRSAASILPKSNSFWKWNAGARLGLGGDASPAAASFGPGQTTQVVSFRVAGGSHIHFARVTISYSFAVLT